MSKYTVNEKDLEVSYMATEIEALVNRIHEARELYPKVFREKVKRKFNGALEELDKFQNLVSRNQSNEQFIQMAELSEIIGQSLDTVKKGFMDDFLVEAPKVSACPCCKSTNIARNALVGVNTKDVTLISDGVCLDCNATIIIK